MKFEYTFRQLLEDVDRSGRYALLAEHLKLIAGETWPEDLDAACVEHCYQSTVEELLNIPTQTVTEPDALYIDMSEDQQYDVELLDIGTDNLDTQPLDFIPWEKLIDLYVVTKDSLPVVEQVAIILYEITIWGFSRDELRNKERDLFGMHKSCFVERWKKKIHERAATAKEFLETQKQDALGDIELTEDPLELASLNEELEEVNVIIELIDAQVEEYIEKVNDSVTDDEVVTVKDVMDIWPPILLPKPDLDPIDVDSEKAELGHTIPVVHD